MNHKFAMGHTFSAQDIFHNFPIKKLKMKLSKDHLYEIQIKTKR